MTFSEPGLLKMPDGPFELCFGHLFIEALAVVKFHCFKAEPQGGEARLVHERCGLAGDAPDVNGVGRVKANPQIGLDNIFQNRNCMLFGIYQKGIIV